MNDNAKKDIRNNVTATGASAVIGGAAGTAAATAIKGMTANAQEIENPEPAPELKPEHRPEPKPEHKPEPKPVSENPEPVKPETVKPEPEKPEPEKPEPEKPEPVKPEPEPEIEILGYERVTNEDGSQSDIAVLNVDGHHAEVLDANIDGKADLLWVDLNDNQQIEEDEVEVVTGENIAMQQFQDAMGYNPLYAQNDIPDYVNDADVDNFMA